MQSMKQISETEENCKSDVVFKYLSSNAPPPLPPHPTLFSSWSVNISFKDDVTVILALLCEAKKVYEIEYNSKAMLIQRYLGGVQWFRHIYKKSILIFWGCASGRILS